MRLDNKTISELEAEIDKQKHRIAQAERLLDKIHGRKDLSDEIVKYFHLGKVGFRKDAKHQERTLNRAIDDGVKACEQYEIRSAAQAIISGCQTAINYMLERVPINEASKCTLNSVKEREKRETLMKAQTLKWEKIVGHYGTAYSSNGYVVERCDTNFVAVRGASGELISHFKTVKDAKSMVGLLVTRSEREAAP